LGGDKTNPKLLKIDPKVKAVVSTGKISQKSPISSTAISSSC
jgi:hypothetical protein